MLSAEKWLTGIFLATCVAIFCLACIGGIINFSSVPYWDMWDGTIKFLQRFSAGDVSAIWEQHNEHRIIVTKLLFLIEYKLLGGSGAFLIAFNFLCVVMAAFAFWQALRWRNNGIATERTCLLAAAGLLAWLSLWTQRDNLIWQFQSQFFLAQLLPLVALLLLARSGSANANIMRDRVFLLATLAGVASVGTMANGLLIQPLLVVGAIFLRLGLIRIFITVAVCIVSFVLYLHGYTQPGGEHSSVTDTLIHSPLKVLKFVALYLGNPFYEVTGSKSYSHLFAGLAGMMFIFLSLLPLRHIFRKNGAHPVDVALILFLAYVGATALITAAGRLNFGFASAFSSRYTTPSLMGWAALFVVYSPVLFSIRLNTLAERIAALAIAIGGSGLLFVYQTQALSPRPDSYHARAVGALAVELAVVDRDYLGQLYPNGDVLLAIGRPASEANLAVFGLERYRDLYSQIGSGAGTTPERACQGFVDVVQDIPGETRYARVRGWAFDDRRSKVPGRMTIVGTDGNIHGFALGGQLRPDVAAAVNPKALRSGFVGYVDRSAIGQPISVVFGGCRVIWTGQIQ